MQITRKQQQPRIAPRRLEGGRFDGSTRHVLEAVPFPRAAPSLQSGQAEAGVNALFRRLREGGQQDSVKRIFDKLKCSSRVAASEDNFVENLPTVVEFDSLRIGVRGKPKASNLRRGTGQTLQNALHSLAPAAFLFEWSQQLGKNCRSAFSLVL